MLNGTSFGHDTSDSALEIPKSQLKFGRELTSGKYGVSSLLLSIHYTMLFYIHHIVGKSCEVHIPSFCHQMQAQIIHTRSHKHYS